MHNNKSSRTNDSGTRSTNSNGNFLYERMFAIEKELENQKRRNSVPIPTQPPVYMMAPPSMVPQHPTQTHTAPTAWSTVAACPPPGMSGMMARIPAWYPRSRTHQPCTSIINKTSKKEEKCQTGEAEIPTKIL